MNKKNILRNIIAAAFLLLIFGGAQAARAQIQPILGCAKIERGSNGTASFLRYRCFY